MPVSNSKFTPPDWTAPIASLSAVIEFAPIRAASKVPDLILLAFKSVV